MNIYRIGRTDAVGYDEWDTFVVIANSPEEARSLVEVGPFRPWRDGSEYDGVFGAWGVPELIGTYIGDKTAPDVILGSFNAG